MKHSWRYLGLLAVTLLALAAPAARAAEVGHGRVSAIEGDLLVKGPDDTEWSYVDRNAVVFDGDNVWADEDSLAEIELERSAWVRLGPDTRVLMRRLPPGGELRLARGSVYVDLSDRTREGVLVETAAGEVDVAPASVARVDVGRGGETRVLVRTGRVKARPTRGGSRTVAAGESFVLNPSAGGFYTIAFGRDDWDAFDTWNDQRIAYYADRSLPRGVSEYLPGIYELADYGDWVDYDGGRYWHPRRVADDWRPYWNGYWGYGRSQLVWMPYEPWGYTTCHYGRWTWADRYGWLWRPDTAWGPGWVRWANADDYLLWAPLDPFGRPVYRRSPQHIGGLVVDALTWSMMPRENLRRRDRALIYALDRAPRVAPRFRLADARPLEPRSFVRDLAADARIRGRVRTERAAAPAPERLRLLESRPPRQEFRIRELRLPDGRRIEPRLPAQLQPGRVPPPPRVTAQPAPPAAGPAARERGTTDREQQRAREILDQTRRRMQQGGRLSPEDQRRLQQAEDALRAQQERDRAARDRANEERARQQSDQEQARRRAEQERAARDRAAAEAARQQAGRDRALRAQQERARQQAEQEQAARDRARQQAEQERAARDRAAAAEAARRRAEQERAAQDAARSRAERERADRERSLRDQQERDRSPRDRQRPDRESGQGLRGTSERNLPDRSGAGRGGNDRGGADRGSGDRGGSDRGGRDNRDRDNRP
jgi:hypothetical protein